MTWHLAPCLDTLRRQVNDAHPGRDKSSDGTIGNAEHAARESDSASAVPREDARPALAPVDRPVGSAAVIHVRIDVGVALRTMRLRAVTPAFAPFRVRRGPATSTGPVLAVAHPSDLGVAVTVSAMGRRFLRCDHSPLPRRSNDGHRHGCSRQTERMAVVAPAPILLHRHRLQMAGIYAGPGLAEVIDLEAFGDRSHHGRVHPSVSGRLRPTATRFAHSHVAVPGLFGAARPEPAFVGFSTAHSAPEPIRFGDVEHTHAITVPLGIAA